MKKIKTLFKKDPTDLSRVTTELDPDNAWVFDDGVKATRKFDGAACSIIGGELYKRYDVKRGKQVPYGAIPCQDPDEITGHWPHWVQCEPSNPADKYFFEAFNSLSDKKDGTYEFCGPKSQGNPEKFDSNVLVPHGVQIIDLDEISYDHIAEVLMEFPIEGIVFHHPDGRMCKIRKTDFGIRRK